MSGCLLPFASRLQDLLILPGMLLLRGDKRTGAVVAVVVVIVDDGRNHLLEFVTRQGIVEPEPVSPSGDDTMTRSRHDPFFVWHRANSGSIPQVRKNSAIEWAVI